MIKLAEENTLPVLHRFLQKNEVYACRVSCLLESFGLRFDFARFYLQLDDSETAVSAIVKYYSDVTVVLTEKSRLSEIEEFIGFLGCAGLFSRPPLCSAEDIGVVMKRRRSLSAEKTYVSCIPVGKERTLSFSPPLRDVWCLLDSCREDGLDVPDYEDFLPDMSHKLRHGTALCAGVFSGDQLLACAMTVAQSEECAVIGGVAVRRDSRRQGLGRACIEALCSRLGERNVYIIRQHGRNREFYEALGFCEEKQEALC